MSASVLTRRSEYSLSGQIVAAKYWIFGVDENKECFHLYLLSLPKKIGISVESKEKHQNQINTKIVGSSIR